MCNLFFTQKSKKNLFADFPLHFQGILLSEKVTSNQIDEVIFPKLELWMDPAARSGEESMAVDEFLMENLQHPLLRVYRWSGDWASIGYFGKITQARDQFFGVNLVRRWTGGGIVDHRADWTYSLLVPIHCDFFTKKSTESYAEIHTVWCKALEEEGVEAQLSSGVVAKNNLCFQNPVPYDIVSKSGIKLAGAAQRRTKFGLLHQGSIAVSHKGSLARARRYCENCADSWQEIQAGIEPKRIRELIFEKYGRKEWLERL